MTIHAYGTVEFFNDPDRLLDIVTRLTNREEGRRTDPWAVTDAPPDFIDVMLKGIVGFAIPITRLEGKWKVSQNRPAEDRGRRDCRPCCCRPPRGRSRGVRFLGKG